MSKENKSMENKEAKKINRRIKLSMCLHLTIAILSVVSIVTVLITKTATVFSHIMKDLIILTDALVWAFICSKTTATAVEDEEDKEQE